MDEVALVTGAAGFIGSHVVDSLLSAGYRVVALDDLSGGFVENVNAGATFINGTVLDVDLLRGLFREHKFGYVFHLAAYAAEGLSHFIRKFNYENNLIGSVNLINASVNNHIKCFVFASSIAVYGRNQIPMTEDMMPCPEDPYGIAKYAVELDLRAALDMFGLPYIVFRPHNVYGERQNIGDRYRNVVGIFMNNILQNKPLPIFGDGQQTRSFSYIRDVAPIIARSIEMPSAYNQTYNVGADTPFSVNELARSICKAMGVSFDPLYLSARHEVKHATASHDRIRAVFGASAPYSLKEGLSIMAKYVKDIGPRQSKSFGELDIKKKLPPTWRDVTAS